MYININNNRLWILLGAQKETLKLGLWSWESFANNTANKTGQLVGIQNDVRIVRDKTGQDRMGQNRTGQNRRMTWEDMTGQYKTLYESEIDKGD